MNEDELKAIRILDSINLQSRFCILECAVFLEEKTSETLGLLLEINWRESESLGYGSASLSFDNKIRLIQDLKGVSKIEKQKFQCFMAIRNKFVHVSEINTFANYLKLINSSKERKNELTTWYPHLDWASVDIESTYKLAYLSLTLSLFRVLFQIDISHVYSKGLQEGKRKTQEDFIRIIKERLQETDEGKVILTDTIDKIATKEES